MLALYLCYSFCLWVYLTRPDRYLDFEAMRLELICEQIYNMNKSVQKYRPPWIWISYMTRSDLFKFRLRLIISHSWHALGQATAILTLIIRGLHKANTFQTVLMKTHTHINNLKFFCLVWKSTTWIYLISPSRNNNKNIFFIH